MRGLFTKIFLGFWVAQSLTFVISTLLILQQTHLNGHRPLQELVSSTLHSEAYEAANAYERAGCAGVEQYADSAGLTIFLADSPTHFVCRAVDSAAYRQALAATAREGGVTDTQIGSNVLWGKTIRSSSGHRYIFFLSRVHEEHGVITWLRDLLHFAFPQLPVAIVVCGVTTFVLVLLLTRPIARLRAAARDLARGKLDTRVPRSDGGRILGGDEIQALVHDFNHMAERLQSLVAAQNMLLRDVSHELRSPLARLSVALELAREEAPTRMLDQLQRIERETGRLNLLIADLLRLSSMESSDAPVGNSEFNLNDLLDELLSDAQFEARQRSCDVSFHASCQCTLRGNPELIYRAVENIVRNSIRYTQEGSVVELELNCEEQSGEPTAILKVSDRGPGISEGEIRNIFQPFYRVDNARQRNTGGFGVGLAITERAVRLHHGRAQAQNRPGGGLVVTLALPCQTVKTAASALPAAALSGARAI